MGRSIEVSGSWLMYLWYASVLGLVPVIVYVWVLPLDDWGSVLGVAVSAGLVLVVGLHLWRLRRASATDHDITSTDLPYGLTYEPGSPDYDAETGNDDDG